VWSGSAGGENESIVSVGGYVRHGEEPERGWQGGDEGDKTFRVCTPESRRSLFRSLSCKMRAQLTRSRGKGINLADSDVRPSIEWDLDLPAFKRRKQRG